MIRSLCCAISLVCIGLPAAAEEDPRVTEALKGLPTEAEINQMMSEMPDLNRLVSGMIDIAQDEDTQATFDRLGNRMKERFDPESFKQTDSDLPDFNAMMDSVAGLAADRESMADILTLAFRMQDVLEDAAQREPDEAVEPAR